MGTVKKFDRPSFLTKEFRYLKKPKNRDLRETIEYGPLCITDLFQNRPVAYF